MLAAALLIVAMNGVAVVSAPPALAAPGDNYVTDDALSSTRTQWWSEARFGMFIHWGLYSAFKGHYGTCQDAEWIKRDCYISDAEYAAKAAQWNPTAFDANKIVALAKAAGKKYIVITSKHHDGFAMWPTAVNDWNIRARTPFQRDPLRELADAAKAAGIKFGVYYSIWDWHDPDFNTNMPAYLARAKAQLRELVTNYDPAVLWFDGTWTGATNPPNTYTLQQGEEIEAYTRSLKPSLVINDRVVNGRQIDGDTGSPEQGLAGGPPTAQLAETCMTINGTWGYTDWDTTFKSPTELTRNLLDLTSNSANYLLNIGPTDTGAVTAGQTAALQGMGTWTAANGAAIYGAGYSGLTTQPSWGRITRKGNKLYLAAYSWPAAGTALHVSRTVPFAVTGARVLGTGAAVTVRAAGDGFDVVPTGAATNPIATVIEADIAPAAAAPVGGGTGLKAEFWNNTIFSGTPAVSRTDPTVNYAWRFSGSPAPSVGTDNFSSRWTGVIEPRYSERYTFTTVSDDTVQLWVNGQPVISNTTPHWPSVDRGGIDLVAGQRYDIRLEHVEGAGEAYVKLIWSSPNTPAQVVPSTQLYPPGSRSGPIPSGIAGKCMDVNGASSADGTAVQLWDCNGTSAQTWTVAGDGTLRALGKCLDISGNSTGNGATVTLWTCHGGGNQKWQSNGLALVNPQSGRCLDDPGAATTNGTQLVIWDCHGGANQRWTLP
jgi:alpha-L-fucosidase